MAYERCIFCGSTENPPSREDVLPRWVARTFPEGKKTRLLSQLSHSKKGALKKARRVGEGTFGILTHGVCQPCNNGWMSTTLEKAVQPILEPILGGEMTILTAPQQALIARWIWKTTMLYEYGWFHSFGKFQTRGKTAVFGEFDHQALYTKQPIPHGTFIFLGHFVDPTLAAWVPDPDYKRFTSQVFMGFVNAYKHTVAINHLAFHFWAVRRPKDAPPIDDSLIDISLPPPWDAIAPRLFPLRDPAFAWPPPLALDDRGMRDLRDI
jgi:hypothetical protein